MDFALSDEQQALREGVARFCKARVGLETLRRLEGTGFDRGLWSELAALGVFGLRVANATDARAATDAPDAAGSPDMPSAPDGPDAAASGLAEAVLVFEALGRAVAPGPILWSHLAAGLVPGAATGEVIVTGIERAVDAEGPAVVEHLESADVLLVLREDGIERLDARQLRRDSAIAERSARPLDPLTPVHRLARLPRGERIGDAAHAIRLQLEGTVLSAALLLGIAEETATMATRHAGERQQFERPIGSFQAIKHLLADAFTRQALARATVYAAGVLLDAAASGAHAATRRTVAAAKLIAGHAALENARTCIQVHGGMGFTWESPVHYYLKRTWVLENGFGTATRQAESLATAIAAQVDAFA